MPSIPERVAKGAALLDEKLPGWHDRIDLDQLRLSSPCNCILGQTWDGEVEHGDDPFFLHANRLFGRESGVHVEAAHGFNSVHSGRAAREEFGELTAEWRRIILARRGGAQ
ncbi:hypothetical protein GCM10023196_036150 [Actinoallomurus vinaceus]|uniref:Uncharacterized protein n=1 Tax=Actinoallomurus vinaceus TaxID=1080074 RepID=A0ABP8UAM9_9ACTN